MTILNKNDFMAVALDEVENRIMFLDSDNKYISDWMINNRAEDINEAMKLLRLDANDITRYWFNNIGYNCTMTLGLNKEQTEYYKKDYGDECIMRFGENYLFINS